MKRDGVEEQYVIDDFTSKDTWRIFRIMAEFVEGFETLGKNSAGCRDIRFGARSARK